MGEFIVRVADALQLEKPHVVGPDLGTAAALFAAAAHFGRFLSLVVGTGGAAVPFQFDSRCGCVRPTSNHIDGSVDEKSSSA
jgi:pimeloyl-ACP methyl ester carboxylesterase